VRGKEGRGGTGRGSMKWSEREKGERRGVGRYEGGGEGDGREEEEGCSEREVVSGGDGPIRWGAKEGGK